MALFSALTSVDPKKLSDYNGVYRFEFIGKQGKQVWILTTKDGEGRIIRTKKDTPDAKIIITLPNVDISSLITDLSKQLNAIIKWNLELEDENKTVISVIIDAKNVDVHDAKPDVDVTMSKTVAHAIAAQELNPQTAFMEGKLKLMGNMAVAMKLATLQATLETRLAKARL